MVGEDGPHQGQNAIGQRDLDKATSVSIEARCMLLDSGLPDGELRVLVCNSIGRDELEQAPSDVTGMVRPDDMFCQDLSAKAVRLLPTLLRASSSTQAPLHRLCGEHQRGCANDLTTVCAVTPVQLRVRHSPSNATFALTQSGDRLRTSAGCADKS